MDQLARSETVTPNPGLPRTIGVLNIVLGLALTLCGLACLAGLSRALRGNPWAQLDPALTALAAREMRRDFVEGVRAAEDSAGDPAERSRLRAVRARIEERPESVEGRVDFARVNRGTGRLARYLWIDVITGLVLNPVMAAAGVGLVRLTRWGLRLGVWVAGLKLARQVALGVLLAAWAVPALQRGLEEFTDTDFTVVTSAQMTEDQRRGQGGGFMGAPPGAFEPRDIVALFSVTASLCAITYACLATVFPLAAFVVLTRPAAAAAVASARDAESAEGHA